MAEEFDAIIIGDGTFRALNETASSGPSDIWITPDGSYPYQIYGNASKLIGYSVQQDGSLTEVTSATMRFACDNRVSHRVTPRATEDGYHSTSWIKKVCVFPY